MNLLFICLGNICRSPAAEGIMRRMIAENGLTNQVYVDSAGTYSGHAGELPDLRMRKAAQERGLELTHRSRPLTEYDFRQFDMLLVMDDVNFDTVVRLAPEYEQKSKIRRMTDFCIEFDVDCVPDPYYSDQDGFDYVLDILEDACRGLLRFVQQQSKKRKN